MGVDVEKLLGNELFSINDAVRDFVSRETADPWLRVNIRTELIENPPLIFSYTQLKGFEMGEEGIKLRPCLDKIIFSLLENCEKHAGLDVDVTIRTRLEGEFVFIDIEDDGPGIEDVDKLTADCLFGNYYNLSSSLAAALKATMGLGGVIIPSNIEDAEGKVLGARFTVQLPLDRSKMNKSHAWELRSLKIGNES